MPPTFVIFGASADLTKRKLVLALFKLHQKKRLKEGLRVVGFSRSPFSHEEWRKELDESTAKFAPEAFDAAAWAEFAKGVFYRPGDIGEPKDFDGLRGALTE